MEPFGDLKYDIGNTPMPEIVKDGYALPENANEVSNYYLYEININRDKFMALAKENNATPAILVALLASKSIKKLHSDADKPIVCSMASDMRKELGLDNTHKNCVGSLYLPYTEAVEKLPFNEQATTYRKIISYAGQLQLGECDKYVDSMHLYSSGTKGLILNMLSAKL